jgi:hypothetical protein
MDERTLKFICVAKFCRERFFTAYPGLMERIEREISFAITHGYIRSWHGPVRHTAPLLLMYFDQYNRLTGLDKSFFSKMVANYFNVAANTPIQTFESSIVFPAEKLFRKHLIEWGKSTGYEFKSRAFNTVHDSIEIYAYDNVDEINDTELELAISLAMYCCETNREPSFGIPLPAECEVSDFLAGEVCFGGHSVKPKELPDAINEFCTIHRIDPSLMPIFPPEEIGSTGKYAKKKTRIAVASS